MNEHEQGPMENLLEGLDQHAQFLSKEELKAELSSRGIDGRRRLLDDDRALLTVQPAGTPRDCKHCGSAYERRAERDPKDAAGSHHLTVPIRGVDHPLCLLDWQRCKPDSSNSHGRRDSSRAREPLLTAQASSMYGWSTRITRCCNVSPRSCRSAPSMDRMSAGSVTATRRRPVWVWIARDESGLDALAWSWLSTRRRRRAQELTGIRFHVFSEVATKLLARERASLPPPPVGEA